MRSKSGRKVTKSDEALNPATDDIVRFTGVSVSFLRKFYENVLAGRIAKGVQLVVATEKLAKDVPAGRTMKVLESEIGYVPYRKDKNFQPYKKSQVKLKPRSEWTIGDMCDFVILPLCESSSSFYLDFVDHTSVGREFQGSFVSQARQCSFEKLVHSLEVHFGDKNLHKEFVWLDIFCVNQPRLTNGHPDVLKKKLGLLTHGFHSAIRKFDHFVMFFDSWEDPIPLKRAWCIWELYGAAISRKPIQIALLPTERQVFIDALREYYDITKFAILGIQPKEAQCFDEEDLAMIRTKVDKDVGWATLKSLVVKELLRWMTKMAKEAIVEAENEINEAGVLHLGTTITNADKTILLRGFDKESVVYQKIIAKIIPASRLMCSTGIFLRDNASEVPLEEVLEYFEKSYKLGVMGNDNPLMILQTLNNMASIHYKKNDSVKALDLWEKCYDGYTQIKFRQGMAGTLNNIGATQQELGEYEKALESFRESYQICVSALGEKHEDVGNPLLNMGKAYECLGNYDRALDSYQKSLNVFLSVYMSEDHRNVANVYEKIGGVNFKQGNWAGSLEMFEKAYDIKISIYGGDNNPETTNLLHDIGIVLLNKGDYTAAVKKFEKVYNLQRARYQSDDNIAVVQALDDLSFARAKVQAKNP
mmetsp:Transcript_91/g.152  ORF Transcript_91/g.152 Transcript_91/m.152 type:complete len:646 (+) Transcript_91:247-2184(+)|eukprot:CAMPEP_0204862520 /NCGR_PEP_ID=MMETSP1348-20121228/2583_1 /ASSEMBLY_ACC=CAM_ASM_000700 /TAXON_ID=215587 /ORGANISM="Aplanochytrium stocchinoi, Strain GSBS06" /LENGTH=645 /DNA_ID=CAMNT_0052012495 /DNA_START=240 /DNA_END=2177 /DNA_ORIENTATION=+